MSNFFNSSVITNNLYLLAIFNSLLFKLNSLLFKLNSLLFKLNSLIYIIVL